MARYKAVFGIFGVFKRFLMIGEDQIYVRSKNNS